MAALTDLIWEKCFLRVRVCNLPRNALTLKRWSVCPFTPFLRVRAEVLTAERTLMTATAEGAERGRRGLDRDALLRTTQRDQPIGVQLR